MHLIKYDKELSITFNYLANNNSYILIKTPEGDSYFFGGPSASESTKTWLLNGAGSTYGIDYAQNAFYLYQISYLNGGAIDFTYETLATSSVPTKIGIQESAQKSATSNSGCFTATPRPLYIDIQRLVRLKKIKSTFLNSQYVEFDADAYGENNRMSKLNYVYLKDANGNVLKKIKLSYHITLNETNALERKFFLENVEFFNSSNGFEYKYELLYDSLDGLNANGLPSKNSFAQDELGYYNGKTGNTTLLPKTTNNSLNNACYKLADREANLTYAMKGSLSQIKYPTGGYTQFEYELPYKGKVETTMLNGLVAYYRNPQSNYSSTVGGSGEYSNCTGSNCTYSSVLWPDGGDNSFDTSDTTITMTLNTMTIGGFTHNNTVLISAIDGNGDVAWSTTLNLPSNAGGNNLTLNYTNNYSCFLPAGSYSFKLTLNLTAMDPAVNSVVSSLQLNLPNGYRNVYNPGLRIKRVKTYDNNSNIQTTRYYYNSLNKIGAENYSFYPNFINITRGLDSGDPPTAPLKDIYNLNANSVKNAFGMNGQIYKYVTVSYGGDNFENGGKQMTFNDHSDYPPLVYQTNPVYQWNESEYSFGAYVDVATNDSYENSVLEEEIYYDANKTPLRKVKYNYLGTFSTAAHNIKVYKFVPSINYGLDHSVYLLYKTQSIMYRLMSTRSEEYVNGNLLAPLVSETFNYYDPDKVSLPNAIVTTTSLTETKRTNIYYPSNVTLATGAPQITGFSTDDVAKINLLQNSKHNVAQVIKAESLLNGTVLETKQLSFGTFIGNNILPSIIKASKGVNSLEDRVIYHEYNSYGNPTLVSQKNGPPISYRYNDLQQVDLKFEGAFNNPLNDGVSASDPCYYQLTYQQYMVTKYNYDATNKLINIIDPKCDKIQYIYDFFGRLSEIRDKDSNILSDSKYHFRP